MKLHDWLSTNTKQLEQADISTPRLDCLILLEDVIGKDRAWLLAHSDHELGKYALKTLEKQLSRRTKHEPLAYIRGKSEFYGRDFAVNAHTLQPRPETETMIELLKQVVISRQSSVASQDKENKTALTSDRSPATSDNDPTIAGRLHGSDAVQGASEQRTESYMQYDEGAATGDWRLETRYDDLTVIDVGTGSGCIAITVKLLYPKAHVIAIDIDEKCLKLAHQNAAAHKAEIEFHKGNLLEPLTKLSAGKQVGGDTLILLANLPYVPESHTINQAAAYEPEHAIFGGDDGLKYYRELFEQTENTSPRPTAILTEALPPQHSELEVIAEKSGYLLQAQQDFIQVFTLQQ